MPATDLFGVHQYRDGSARARGLRAARGGAVPALKAPARLALVALSAALYGAAFPPLAFRECAWLALVPLLIALRDVSPARAALLGGVWGVLAAEAVGTWFASGVATYYGRSLLLGAAFFAGVSLLLAAPFFAIFAAAYAYGVGHRTIVSEVI
jgi:apolipoprotein N-acyltransferase